MPTPIIPENITVHLGPPNSDAPNITLPFRDYIKNVASSEIYPTWPEAALRANILAQITFDFSLTQETEASTEATTEAATEAGSESATEAATEAVSKATTEAGSEVTTEAATEAAETESESESETADKTESESETAAAK